MDAEQRRGDIMGHQGWLAAPLVLALAWMAQPARAQTPAQADARAATQRQTRQTDQANRDAAVPDEAGSAATGASPARAGANADGNGAGSAPQALRPYGPVLYLDGKPVTDSAHRDPAEVHDEADSVANPAAQPAPPQRRKSQPARRRPARQPETEAMAPRPLHGEREASQGVPVPPPAAAPRPAAPGSNVINGCQGSVCMDASGKTYNGISNGSAGVDASGRLCTRSGVTVQCF
jgi:hypothetical protein